MANRMLTVPDIEKLLQVYCELRSIPVPSPVSLTFDGTMPPYLLQIGRASRRLDTAHLILPDPKFLEEIISPMVIRQLSTKEPPMSPSLPKFSLEFKCPKCGSDKCGTRLDNAPETEQDRIRRGRLKWPPGELMVQTCMICGHVQISRPLDFQEPGFAGQTYDNQEMLRRQQIAAEDAAKRKGSSEGTP